MILHGRDIVILDANGKALIGAAKSCEIDIKVDTQEVSSPYTGTWKTYITKRKEWAVSISHLLYVQNFPTQMLAVGNSVTLKIQQTSGNRTPAPFAGVYGGAIEDHTTSVPTSYYWHGSLNQFVGYLESTGKYYKNWLVESLLTNPYASPSEQYDYTYNGLHYFYDANATGQKLGRLYPLSGTAICTNAKVTATCGNLASGSFQFLGNGELSLVTTVPSSADL